MGKIPHHEFYDIRDGYVTDKDYTPGYWSTDCTGSGSSRSCSETYHPPTWSVTINFEGDSAKWEVSEGEYNQISYGDWYCARDFLHEAPCVRNKQF